jgi:hypothetical protein
VYSEGAGGSVVVEVEAQCYKPEGPGFNSLKSMNFFSIYLILPAILGPGAYSVIELSTRNRKRDVSGE